MNISSYCQIIKITNQSLQPWLILHIYMPFHSKDIRLIEDIKNNITTQINNNPNHTYILCGDFNRDIALIGRQPGNQNTPPQTIDLQWHQFTKNLNFNYVHTDIPYSRQGGYNYNDWSLIDRFYIRTTNHMQLTSTKNKDIILNSNHSPIQLHIPNNILIGQTPTSLNKTTYAYLTHSKK